MAAPMARWRVVYTELKNRIQNLELEPGHHLSESGVAAQFGLSETPVRDALGRLSQEGLLTVQRGRGYTVAPLSIGEISEISDLRFILEAGAARLSIQRLDPSALPALRELSIRTGESGIDNSEMVRRNCDFHVALADLASSAKLTAAVRRVMDSSVRFFHLGLPAFAAHGMQEDHDALIAAIESGDEDAALEILRREAYDTTQRVLEDLVKRPELRTARLLSPST